MVSQTFVGVLRRGLDSLNLCSARLLALFVCLVSQSRICRKGWSSFLRFRKLETWESSLHPPANSPSGPNLLAFD